MNYTVPGVYVREIATLPPSVAAVATAIPAFVGYTEKALDKNGASYPADEIVVRRVDSLLEYEQYFGENPKLARFKLEANSGKYEFVHKQADGATNATTLHSHLMYYAMRMFYDNGGGSCYIVSVDRYDSKADTAESIATDKIKDGIEKLKEFDEPTLIVLPDAINLASPSDYYARCEEVLAQCNLLQDRFGLFDVLQNDTDAAAFREGIGSKYLKYGAAYMPYLKTAISYQYKDEDVDVGGAFWNFQSDATDKEGIKVLFPDLTIETGNEPKVSFVEDAAAVAITFETSDRTLLITGPASTAQDIVAAWNTFGGDKGGFSITLDEAADGSKAVDAISGVNMVRATATTLASIKDTFTQLYNQLKAQLIEQRVILPPSSAMAGIYSSVDRDRGVWKAPANISVSSLIEPVRKITNEQQGRLNVDPTSGKSINVIRSFTGRGTLVWGARTLAGNDNEWRYINVRRLFIFIEESIQKATAFAVFESNTATTWLKVKGMIESFLYGLWQQGALAGSTPEAAYRVSVGLGKTMTPQDILEGRLIIEVSIAAVRPAEFIILRFMHKLQEP